MTRAFLKRLLKLLWPSIDTPSRPPAPRSVADVLRELGLSQPTPPAASAPIAAPEWKRPSAQMLDAARGSCSMWNSPHVKVCRGPGKGCPADRDQTACPDCFLVAWHDRRSSAELLQAMERGDA